MEKGNGMSIYRDKAKGCWVSSCRFKDANGTPKRTTKRGFGTKKEAEEWERRLKPEANIRTLTLFEFFRVYSRDIKPTVAVSTWEDKAVLFKDKIEPYLGETFVESSHLKTYCSGKTSCAPCAKKTALAFRPSISER